MPGKIIAGAFAVAAGLTLAACSPSPAQPKTAASARAAATSFLALSSAGQWASAYQLLSPAAQHAVGEATWAKVQAAASEVRPAAAVLRLGREQDPA